MSKVTCGNCQALVEGGKKFCSNCGELLMLTQKKPSTPDSEPSTMNSAAAVFGTRLRATVSNKAVGTSPTGKAATGNAQPPPPAVSAPAPSHKPSSSHPSIKKTATSTSSAPTRPPLPVSASSSGVEKPTFAKQNAAATGTKSALHSASSFKAKTLPGPSPAATPEKPAPPPSSAAKAKTFPGPAPVPAEKPPVAEKPPLPPTADKPLAPKKNKNNNSKLTRKDSSTDSTLCSICSDPLHGIESVKVQGNWMHKWCWLASTENLMDSLPKTQNSEKAKNIFANVRNSRLHLKKKSEDSKHIKRAVVNFGTNLNDLSQFSTSPAEVVESEKKRLGTRYSPNDHLLHECTIGDLEMVRYLVEHEPIVKDYANKNGDSHIQLGQGFLQTAIKFDNAEVAEYLRKHGFPEKADYPFPDPSPQLRVSGPESPRGLKNSSEPPTSPRGLKSSGELPTSPLMRKGGSKDSLGKDNRLRTFTTRALQSGREKVNQTKGKINSLRENTKKNKDSKENLSAPPKKAKKMFGVSFTEVAKRENRANNIPLIVETCANWLRENDALKTEGIFRISGSAAEINKLAEMYDEGLYPSLQDNSVHNVSGLLKKYLREQPEPLLLRELYGCFIIIWELNDRQIQLAKIKNLIAMLPDANRELLRYLLDLISETASHSATNKMTVSNLAVVFGPILLSSEDFSELISDSTTTCEITTLMIEEKDSLF